MFIEGLFDFDDYLQHVDAGQSYKVDRLTGGIINVTARALRRPSLGPSRFLDHTSIVLKHAKPYVATRGPNVPLSLKRQVSARNASR